MNELTDLLHSNYDWAMHRAADALNINNAFLTGTLSKQQAIELLQDVINTDELDKVANDFTTRTKLVNAITQLISTLSDVTSIPGI